VTGVLGLKESTRTIFKFLALALKDKSLALKVLGLEKHLTLHRLQVSLMNVKLQRDEKCEKQQQLTGTMRCQSRQTDRA